MCKTAELVNNYANYKHVKANNNTKNHWLLYMRTTWIGKLPIAGRKRQAIQCKAALNRKFAYTCTSMAQGCFKSPFHQIFVMNSMLPIVILFSFYEKSLKLFKPLNN